MNSWNPTCPIIGIWLKIKKKQSLPLKPAFTRYLLKYEAYKEWIKASAFTFDSDKVYMMSSYDFNVLNSSTIFQGVLFIVFRTFAQFKWKYFCNAVE